MTTKPDGGPVYPVRLPIPGALHACDEPAPTELHTGASLRDHFAGRVLPAIYAAALAEATQGSGLFSDENWRVGIALDAYAMADAMLEARKC